MPDDTKAAAAVDIDGYAGELSADHPGFNDEDYKLRREEIGRIATEYRRGAFMPHAPYSDEEHAVWALVQGELRERHRQFAPKVLVEAGERLGLPTDHIPQLDEVSGLLEPLTGFRYEPVAGLVAIRDFYSVFGDGWFRSTQYIRHASAPRYTPEPDVIHEVIGHGTHLADDTFAHVYREFGQAAARLRTDEALSFLSRVFWFTMEFGAVKQGEEMLAYGAGLLSSYGEIENFRTATLREFDLNTMGRTSYDITKYQSDVFVAPSMGELVDTLVDFLGTFDDDEAQRRIAAAA